MNARTLLYLEKLKQAIAEDRRFALLDELDEQVQADEEAKRLSADMSAAAEEYSTAVGRYEKASEEAKQKLKILAEAQQKLNSYPLVDQYNKAYREVSGLYLSINDILFGDVNKYPFGGARD